VKTQRRCHTVLRPGVRLHQVAADTDNASKVLVFEAIRGAKDVDAATNWKELQLQFAIQGAFVRLVDQGFPAIQRAIEAMHHAYPGPTVVEANSIGQPIIENLRLPDDELIAHTTTKASKQAMLNAIELQLQQQTLKIHPDFQQLLAELAEYRLPDGSLTQDSVMALGFAVTYANRAHARTTGSIIWKLFEELNNGPGPPASWLDRQKITSDGLSYGLVRLNPPPGSDRHPYQADALTGQLEEMLAQGWTVADPAALDKLGLGHLVTAR